MATSETREQARERFSEGMQNEMTWFQALKTEPKDFLHGLKGVKAEIDKQSPAQRAGFRTKQAVFENGTTAAMLCAGTFMASTVVGVVAAPGEVTLPINDKPFLYTAIASFAGMSGLSVPGYFMEEHQERRQEKIEDDELDQAERDHLKFLAQTGRSMDPKNEAVQKLAREAAMEREMQNVPTSNPKIAEVSPDEGVGRMYEIDEKTGATRQIEEKPAPTGTMADLVEDEPGQGYKFA